MWSHSCSGYVYQVTLRPGSKQDPREFSVTGHRVLAVGGEHLNPDVVRACFEMGMQARSNGVGGAVQHEGVDEAVAAAALEVSVGVAVAPEVVGVVR